MKAKVVKTKTGKWRIKVKFMFFFWMDPGFPSFDTEEKAKKSATSHFGELEE